MRKTPTVAEQGKSVHHEMKREQVFIQIENYNNLSDWGDNSWFHDVFLRLLGQRALQSL